MRAARSRLVWSIATALLAGCIHPHPTPTSDVGAADRIVITEEQIARCGASNAWDVLKRLAPQFTFREDRNGQPSVLERRGRSSILLSDAPRVFVDGAEMVEFRNLIQIPADNLRSIEILGSIEGTTLYGSNAVSGVILLRTKNGS
jgi:outer membrane cobalamin receptor